MRKSRSRQHGNKPPSKPAPAAPAPQPAARWQRTQRYAWDKGGAKGGRK